MPRAARSTIDDVVRSAIQGVMRRVAAQIARAVAEVAARQVDAEIGSAVARAGRVRGRARKARSSRRAGDITRWVADRRARRVPNFVIEATGGLDTKKKIVARYGEGAAFEKGKPLPKVK
ncbi:MAG TPA: hypothetical protein VH880_11100 [Anaeromyxobacteraceae bacterium]|jgi:hypothetical protein